ncbi:unnamed protein product, partial [Ectocarpus sp. 8 AP-2014]
SPLEDVETLGSRSSAAVAHSGVVGGMLGGRGRGGGRHARLETESERLARRSQRMLFWALSAVAGLLAILVGLVAVAVREGIHVGDGGGGRQTYDEQQQEGSVAGDGSGGREVSRIAFGSCTSRGIQDDPGQPIWTQAIVPAEPDAWIWAGDMAYLDNPA